MKTPCAHSVGLLLIALGFAACSGGEPTSGKSEAINLPDEDNPYCDSTNAKTGVACTVDCSIPCGFAGLGQKYCTCANGAYWQCPCIPPEGWQGPLTAPCCSEFGSAEALSLKNTPCDDAGKGAQCVGTDANTGTPKGCACLENPVTHQLQWYCGSTNHWFSPEPGAHCG